ISRCRTENAEPALRRAAAAAVGVDGCSLEGTGGETPALLYPRRPPGLHGTDHAFAQSGGRAGRLYCFRAQPESGCIHHWAFRGGHGTKDREMAHRYGGYGEGAGGNLTSGGTMANFIGLKLARDWASRDRAQHDGMHERWAVYMSEERHVSVDKAVDCVGA